MAASPDGSVVFVSIPTGIDSVNAPTATHPHSYLSSSFVVANPAALAVDPAGNVVYAADPAQGLVFSIQVSNGVFFSPPRYSFVPLGAYPGSIVAATFATKRPPHWPP
jgi:DNA-binding beta-propeller fold protein YncE